MSVVSDIEDLAVSALVALVEKKIPPGALVDTAHAITKIARRARDGQVTVETAAAEIRRLSTDIANNDAIVDAEIEGGS